MPSLKAYPNFKSRARRLSKTDYVVGQHSGCQSEFCQSVRRPASTKSLSCLENLSTKSSAFIGCVDGFRSVFYWFSSSSTTFARAFQRHILTGPKATNLVVLPSASRVLWPFQLCYPPRHSSHRSIRIETLAPNRTIRHAYHRPVDAFDDARLIDSTPGRSHLRSSWVSASQTPLPVHIDTRKRFTFGTRAPSEYMSTEQATICSFPSRLLFIETFLEDFGLC